MAARGIDIPLLDYVINFDFVSKPKVFVHRVGRVARAGRSGTAYSLVSRDEVDLLHALTPKSNPVLSLATFLIYMYFWGEVSNRLPIAHRKRRTVYSEQSLRPSLIVKEKRS